MGKIYDVYFEKLNKAVTWMVLCFSLFTFNLGFGQINQSFSFNTNMDGWTGTFYTTTSYPCEVGSAMVNVYQYNPTANMISPALSISNGELTTLNFSSKAINWNTANQAAPLNAYTLNVQWSSNQAGPWNTIQTLTNDAAHGGGSNSCFLNTVTFTPSEGQIYVRFNLTIQGTNDINFYVDNVSVSQQAGPCDPVNALSVTGISASTLDVSWTQATGNLAQSFDYELRTSGTPGSGATGLVNSGSTTNMSTSFTSLSANTNYTFYVRRLCSAGVYSGWYPLNVLTPCSSFNVPFQEGFNSTSSSEVCWTVLNANNDGDSWDLNYTSNPFEGNQVAVFYSDYNNGANDDWLISPAINMNGTMRLRFNYRVQSSGEPNDFEIRYSTSGNLPSNFTNVVMPLTSFSNETYQEMIVYIPNTGQNVGYVAFRVPPGGLDGWRLYIDNVRIDVAPTCIEVQNITVGTITKNSAVLSWTPTISSATATYTWEVRTSGLPGSGTVGLVQTGTTAAGVTTATINNLDPSTTYYFYVKANCSSTDSSPWDEQEFEFTTMCNYPDLLTTTSDTICGIGSGTLSATSSSGILMWSATPTGGVLYTGNDFQTPIVNTSTTFYVRTGDTVPNTTVQLGNGTSTSTSAGTDPYYHGWGGQKVQYIFKVDELLAAGLSPGPINSIAFDAGSTGSALNNFSVAIGHTNQNVGTLTYITGLTQVVAPFTHNVVVGLNTLSFNTPFVWDGVSNIVIQTSYSNNNSGGSTPSVRYHTAAFISTSYKYSDNVTADVMLGNTTASYTASTRPNVYFNGIGLCSSLATPVELIVTEPPVLTLNTNELTVCQGNVSDELVIISGANEYDTYVWSPSEGVSGNAESGWVFNPQESTTYTLVASQSQGICSKDMIVNIDVVSLGYQTLEETYVTCSNQPLELSIAASEVDINTLPALNLLFLGLNDASNLGITFNGNNTTFSHQTNLYSEGTGSIKLFPSTSASANIEINQTVDLSNSYGLLLEFDHVALLESQYWAWDYGYVQYSTNGGNTWTTFTKNQYIGTASTEAYTVTNDMRFARDSYADWSGTMNNTKWKGEKFFLPYASNMNALKLRFVVVSDGSVTDDSWYIDNIRIKKVSLPEIEWSPATHLFVDAALTQPYAGESIGTVYFKHDASGNYPYQVSISNDLVSCATTVNTEVVIPELVFPGLTNSFYCTATDVNDLQFNSQNGVTYNWFNSIYSQTPLDVIPFTGTYYVQVVAGDCIGSRSPVQINIIGNVNVQVNPNQSFCEGATVASLLATPSNPAATVQWFDSIDATQPLASTIVLQAGTTYYVNQVYYGCQSTKLPVNIIINQTPDPITISELTVCSNSTIGSVVIPNNTALLHWYASMNSTTPLSSQVILTPGTYYISTYAGVCDSQRMPVNVTIVENLAQPQVNVIDICGSGFVSDLNAYVSNAYPAAELRWYNTSTGTNALSQDQVLTTGTYYVEQYLTGCTSTRKAVAVRVTSKVAPVINAQVVCDGTKIQDVVLPAVSNVIYNWYTTPTSTQALASNTVLTTGNYYVRRFQYGCLSDATMVSVNVLATPTPPTGNLQQVLPEGSVISDIIMNQPGIVWYNTQEDAQNNTNPLLPNMPLENGHTYYGVLVSSNGCRSVAVAVTINLYLGLNDLDIASLKVYPNPTSDSITVSYSEAIDSVEVYSMLGQKVLDKKGANTEISLDLSHLSSGTYIIKVLVGQNSQLVKVVKK